MINNRHFTRNKCKRTTRRNKRNEWQMGEEIQNISYVLIFTKIYVLDGNIKMDIEKCEHKHKYLHKSLLSDGPLVYTLRLVFLYWSLSSYFLFVGFFFSLIYLYCNLIDYKPHIEGNSNVNWKTNITRNDT